MQQLDKILKKTFASVSRKSDEKEKMKKKTRMAIAKLFAFHANAISQMSWCNGHRRAGPNFCATDNFSRTFDDFLFKLFTQERISTYVDPCP